MAAMQDLMSSEGETGRRGRRADDPARLLTVVLSFMLNQLCLDIHANIQQEKEGLHDDQRQGFKPGEVELELTHHRILLGGFQDMQRLDFQLAAIAWPWTSPGGWFSWS